MSTCIDLNCDMGEGIFTDELIMPHISSANIACGYHAGDTATIKKTILLAQQYGVAVGAHPSYPDREGFGRRDIEVDINTLYDIIVTQIRLVLTIADSLNEPLRHVKPHGSLYNASAGNHDIASTIARAVKSVSPSLMLFGMPHTESERAAKKEGLRYCREVFCDRTYNDKGMLSPRTESNAFINSTEKALSQAIQAIQQKTVTTTSGKAISMEADTLCIHGDGAQAVQFAKTIKEGLEKQHIIIGACK